MNMKNTNACLDMSIGGDALQLEIKI